MLSTSVRIVRAATVAAWVVATAAVLVLTVMPRVLPVAGRDVLIVRGSSMTPAIPIGAAIVIERTDATNVAIGDVVTFHAANDTVVTHRVVGLGSGTEPSFETKGDASSAQDPLVVPASALMGKVEYVFPGLGQVMVVLSSTIGMVAVLGLLGGLLLAVWFLDELAANLRRAAERGRVVTEPAH